MEYLIWALCAIFIYSFNRPSPPVETESHSFKVIGHLGMN